MPRQYGEMLVDNAKLETGFDPAYKYLQSTALAVAAKFSMQADPSHSPAKTVEVTTEGLVLPSLHSVHKHSRGHLKGIKSKLGSAWTTISLQLGVRDLGQTRSWDPQRRPTSSCLKKSSADASSMCSCDTHSGSSLDSDTFDSLVFANACESVKREKPAMTKSVSFSDMVTLHDTFSGAKYRRKGFGKKPMSHAEIEQIIFEVNRYKALDMELHPDSFGNIHWMKKTVPGQPRMTELAMADLRRRLRAELAREQEEASMQSSSASELSERTPQHPPQCLSALPEEIKVEA